MMRALAALTALFLLVSAAEAAEKSHEVKMVEFFVKTPVQELPAENIDEFLAIDPAKLPAKLRTPFAARKLELQTLKQLNFGKKKGTIRTPEKNCSIPDEAKSDQPAALKMAGFEELTEDEEGHVLTTTECTERDLMCEFSMQIVLERDAKTKRVKRRRYYLYPTDPLMAIVASYRSGKGAGGNTNFFGRGSVLCSH
jgi:hypothetical protein